MNQLTAVVSLATTRSSFPAYHPGQKYLTSWLTYLCPRKTKLLLCQQWSCWKTYWGRLHQDLLPSVVCHVLATHNPSIYTVVLCLDCMW